MRVLGLKFTTYASLQGPNVQLIELIQMTKLRGNRADDATKLTDNSTDLCINI